MNAIAHAEMMITWNGPRANYVSGGPDLGLITVYNEVRGMAWTLR